MTLTDSNLESAIEAGLDANLRPEAAMAEARSIAQRYSAQIATPDHSTNFKELQKKISDDFTGRLRSDLLSHLQDARQLLNQRFGTNSVEFVALNGTMDGLDNLPRSTNPELQPTPFIERIEEEASSAMAELCSRSRVLRSQYGLEEVFADSADVTTHPDAVAMVTRVQRPALISVTIMCVLVGEALVGGLGWWSLPGGLIWSALAAAIPPLIVLLGLAAGLYWTDSTSTNNPARPEAINDRPPENAHPFNSSAPITPHIVFAAICTLSAALGALPAISRGSTPDWQDATIGAVLCLTVALTAFTLTVILNSPTLLRNAITLHSNASQWKAKRRKNETTRAVTAIDEVHNLTSSIIADDATALALVYYDANVYARRNSRTPELEKFVQTERERLRNKKVTCQCPTQSGSTQD